MNKELISFIKKSPTAFQAVAECSRMLTEAGYTELTESESWNITPGKGYFVTRNGSSVIAFRIPVGHFTGFMVTAAHCDSPSFKLKENAEIEGKYFVQLSTEIYGGMIRSTWLDRPLSVAGRLLVKTENGIETRLVDFKEPIAIIPNVAPHWNRNVNDNMQYNAAVDLPPLYSMKESGGTFKERAAALAGVSAEDIVTFDLFVYNPQEGVEWGDFVSAPRLDDLQCAFSSIKAFLTSGTGKGMPICCIFDNEEVGSRTKQGAASTFLQDTLLRIMGCLGKTEEQYRIAVANSMLVSADNAHSTHPNHPELADKNHTVVANGGVVIKYNASQSYTSDAVSSAMFQTICKEAGVPCQLYTNRADIRGGGTLGNISNTQVSMNSVDIGCAQFAMHSAYETCGAKDTEYMVRAMAAFFQKGITMTKDGNYTIE